MVQQRFGIVHQHLHQAPAGRSGVPGGEERVPADEAAGLVPGHGEAEPGLQHGIGVVDVVPVVAIGLLQPQAGQRAQPGVPQPERPAGLDQAVVDLPGVFDRDVQLVPELAEVRQPQAEHPGRAEVELAGLPVAEGRVGHVGGGEPLQHLPGPGPLQVELGVSRGDVADSGAGGADPPAQQRLHVPVRGIRRHHPEPLVVEFGDGQVGLDPAALVQPRGIGDPPGVAVHPVGRQVLQPLPGVLPGDQERRHERQVHDDDVLPGCPVLPRPVGEPARPPPGQLRFLGHGGQRPLTGPGTRGVHRVPLRALPPADLAEGGPGRGQPVMQHRAPHVSGGPPLPARVVAPVDRAQGLRRPLPQVLGFGLIGMQPVEVDAGDVDVRGAFDDPVRQGATDPAAGEDSDRVQPGRDEEVAQFGRLADQG